MRIDVETFSGLNNDAAGEVIDIDVAAAMRHWRFGRAWLHSRL